MYSFLLGWRYLQSRRSTLVCVLCVLLGTTTLVVLNSVVGGFGENIREKLRRIQPDIQIESLRPSGGGALLERLKTLHFDPTLRPRIRAMTSTFESCAILQFECRGKEVVQPVRVIGVPPEDFASACGFSEFTLQGKAPLSRAPGSDQPPDAILGHGIGHHRVCTPGGDCLFRDHRLLVPGSHFTLTALRGSELQPATKEFRVGDYFRTELGEFDQSHVLVPLDELQNLLGMEGRVTSLQIWVRDERQVSAVVERLRSLFDPDAFDVKSRFDNPYPLLAAVRTEQALLNVLLFLITAVAGFCILALFSMIVVEKTRDIGILRSLGASRWGVMTIFLGYGFFLGTVGTMLGTMLGLTLTVHIDAVERCLGRMTGQEIFPRDVFTFDQIPTRIQWQVIAAVNLGAIATAVVFSLIPAIRASVLRPVKALRGR